MVCVIDYVQIEHSFHRLGLKCQIQFAGDIDENCKKAYFANYPIKEEQWQDMKEVREVQKVIDF